MGIGSLFIVNNKTETLCAVKHWGPAVNPNAVCDKVFAALRASAAGTGSAGCRSAGR